jgi:putative transposase
MIMAHSKIKIWVHAIWGTKNRKAFITPDIEARVHELLRQELIQMGCFVESLNGMPDHIHALFLLHPNLSIRVVMKQVKGAVSHVINKIGLCPDKFAWQVGFAAFSVSESKVPVVRRYIERQKQHHSNKAFEEEYRLFLKRHGLSDEPTN